MEARSEIGNMILYKNIGNYLVEEWLVKCDTWAGAENQDKREQINK